MFAAFRQKRNFVVSMVDSQTHFVLVQDLISGLRIEVPYGPKELERAEFTSEYELYLFFQDGSEKAVNLLMQGC